MDELGIVERKVLDVLIDLADGKELVYASQDVIARKIGYKRPGGTITYAIQKLQMRGCIRKVHRCTYRMFKWA